MDQKGNVMRSDNAAKTIEGHIFAWWSDTCQRFIFTFSRGDKDSISYQDNIKNGYILIAPYCIEIEMPDGLDLHKAQLKAFQKQRKLILAENEKRLWEIDEQIGKFQALEVRP
jgi:hypothetical protein